MLFLKQCERFRRGEFEGTGSRSNQVESIAEPYNIDLIVSVPVFPVPVTYSLSKQTHTQLCCISLNQQPVFKSPNSLPHFALDLIL